jgi:anti-sigma regulatory factor (Ser/Thr protein kinase)
MERPNQDAPVTAGQYSIALSDPSHVGESRRTATRAAKQAGLGEADSGKVSIIATELATNILHYAKAGEMMVRAWISPTHKAVDIIALDRGPGMSDLQRCLGDGYSTGGSLGQGLGAARRLSTDFDIYSMPERGTAVYCRVAEDGGKVAQSRKLFEWAAISTPAPGETECGDGWRVAQRGSLAAAAVADGLGHGPLAAVAANEAMRVFDQEPFAAPGAYLETAHQALHSTRGAALAIARVDLERRVLVYAGIGNISGNIISGDAENRTLPSHNGTIGVQIRKVQEFEFQLTDNQLLLMHSDGLQGRWNLAEYPGLSRRSVALIAAVLYRDFKRGRDDTTVLAMRLV